MEWLEALSCVNWIGKVIVILLRGTRTHKELDFCRQADVEAFFGANKPEYAFLATSKVGGIIANSEALADFMYENMILEMNVIHAAWKNGCKKLDFWGVPVSILAWRRNLCRKVVC